MRRYVSNIPTFWTEVVFQIVLHVVLFVFFSFDRNNPTIDTYTYFAFLNYAAGAFVINYIALPKLYYQKKYIYFAGAVLLIIAALIAIDELILEHIFFPNTRALRFYGVFYNLLDVAPIITVFTSFKFAWDAARKTNEVEQLKSLVKDSELQYLKSQINPHFLFNNLNNLYAYALEQSEDTPKIILELSTVLRYMLYDCKADYVPVSKDIEHLEHFTQLNKLQIENRGSITYNAHIAQLNYSIAPLILSVFVENAFKHSSATQADAITIAINVSINAEGLLKFSCINNFSSANNTVKTTSGIGLHNVKKRLALLYPNAHSLNITTQNNSYKVLLTLQLKQNTP